MTGENRLLGKIKSYFNFWNIIKLICFLVACCVPDIGLKSFVVSRWIFRGLERGLLTGRRGFAQLTTE